MDPSRASDPIGSISWTERSGGVLTGAERRRLLRPLLRGHRDILLGALAMATGTHSGRRNHVDPDSLIPPDSALAREAEAAARDLLTESLFNHSLRSYAWGAAIAALDGLAFDRELLYLAALFHDTGLGSPTAGIDFTVRSAALAREFGDRRNLPGQDRELVANAIALHHTPGVSPGSGAEAFLLSSGAAVDVFGLRCNHIPDAVRASVVADHPRAGFKREFAALFRAEARSVPHGRAWYLHRYAVSDVTIRLAPFRG